MAAMVGNELNFYAKFTKPLILNLPDPNDRVLAAGWVKKILSDEDSSEKLRIDYIKLLLFALQRKKLVGIFADDAAQYEKLEVFPSEFDLNTMARQLIEKEQKERQDRIRTQLTGQVGDFPPYTTDWSANYKEYVAAQDIPGFGVHCYYAMSKEPVSLWKKVDKAIFPRVAKSAVDTTSPLPPPGEDICICPQVTDDSECKAKGTAVDSANRKKSKKLGKSPPLHPIGKVSQPEGQEIREPPIWGSNLLEIRPSLRTDQDEDEPKPKYTGAIPKVKGQGVKIIYDDNTTIEEIEQALKDFRTGEISGIHRKQKSPVSSFGEQLTADSVLQTEFQGTPFQDVAGALISPEAVEAWESIQIQMSVREEEVQEDSDILENFKKQLVQGQTRQTIAETEAKVQSTIPAKAGLPVTTPRQSVSPKRIESTEKLYTPDLAPLIPRTDLKKKATKGKEKKMVKMFEDISFAIADDEDKEKEECLQRQREEEERVQEAEARAKEEEARLRQMEEEEKKRKYAELKKSQKSKEIHIQRSSPEANAIIADFIETYKTTNETEETEEMDDSLFQSALDQTAMGADHFSVQDRSCVCKSTETPPMRTVQEREVTVVTERPQEPNVYTVQPAASEMFGAVPAENVYEVEQVGTADIYDEYGVEEYQDLPYCKQPPVPSQQKKLSRQEQKYLDVSLAGDAKQRNLIKRVAAAISDVPEVEEEPGNEAEDLSRYDSPPLEYITAIDAETPASVDKRKKASGIPYPAGAAARTTQETTAKGSKVAPGSRIPGPGVKGAAPRSQIPGPPEKKAVAPPSSGIARPTPKSGIPPPKTQVPRSRPGGIPQPALATGKVQSRLPTRGAAPEIVVTEPTQEEVRDYDPAAQEQLDQYAEAQPPEERCECDPALIEQAEQMLLALSTSQPQEEVHDHDADAIRRFKQMRLFNTSPPEGFDEYDVKVSAQDVIPVDFYNEGVRDQQLLRRERRHAAEQTIIDDSYVQSIREEMVILPPQSPSPPRGPYYATPKRVICQRPTEPGKKFSRVTKDTGRRRIDFDQEEEDPRFAHLPPLPPGSPPPPPQLLDAPLPFGLPEPIRPPTVLFGYSSPEHLKIKKPPPLSLQPPSTTMFFPGAAPPVTSWSRPQYNVDVPLTTPPDQYITCQSYITPEGSPVHTPIHTPDLQISFGEDPYMTPGKAAEEIFQMAMNEPITPAQQSSPQMSDSSPSGGIDYMMSRVELSRGKEGIVRRPHIMAKTHYSPEMEGIQEQSAYDTYQQFQYQYPWERIQMEPRQLDFEDNQEASCEPCRNSGQESYLAQGAAAYEEVQSSQPENRKKNKCKSRLPLCRGPGRKK